MESLKRRILGSRDTRRSFNPLGLSVQAIVLTPLIGLFSALSVTAEDTVIEEVIVTAQKRAQSIQDVPIAIAAFDREFLDDAGVDDILELQFFVPGLTIANNQSPAQTNINIRGVGTAGNSLSLESSVGIYIDGVYRSRQSSSIADLLDIERVEVLKGPQGTLFGKNTASGAVQFLSVKPDLERLSGFLEAQGGSENFVSLTGAINAPVTKGTSAIRFSAGTSQRDGFVQNLTTGSDLNNLDRYSLRAQFLHENDAFSARLIGDYSELNERCCAAGNIYDGPGDSIPRFLAAGGTLPPTGNLPGASFLLPLDFVGNLIGFTGIPNVLAKDFEKDLVAQDIDPYAEIFESGVSAELTWHLSDVSKVTSITAYRSFKSNDFVDADFNSLDILRINGGATDQDTFSQELRISGSYGERLNYVTGLYYFDQKLERELRTMFGAVTNVLLTGGLPTSALIPGGSAVCPFIGVSATVCDGPAFPSGEYADNLSTQEQHSWAIFGQSDLYVTENLVLTAGLRYLDEKKDMNVMFIESIFSPVWAAFTPFSPLVPDVNDITFKDTATTGTVKLTYFLNPELMGYLAWGKGYKSGGTNIDRISPATGAPLLFDPETSDSIEIGVKGDFLDKRLRLNIAAHQTDFKDFQANTFVGTGFVLQNAGEIRSRGFEADLLALINSWLFISGGAAFVDAEYTSFVGGACIRTPFGDEPDATKLNFPTVCNVSGNRVGSTPEWSYYASLVADRQIGAGTIYGRLDYNWRGDMLIGNDNDPNKLAKTRGIFNAKLSYRFDENRYEISVWAKNAFDKDYRESAFNTVIREGSLSAFHTEPRTFGATFRFVFQ